MTNVLMISPELSQSFLDDQAVAFTLRFDF
jgi:hypothetical protein